MNRQNRKELLRKLETATEEERFQWLATGQWELTKGCNVRINPGLWKEARAHAKVQKKPFRQWMKEAIQSKLEEF